MRQRRGDLVFIAVVFVAFVLVLWVLLGDALLTSLQGGAP
jgi:hypothetical protein